MNSTLYINPPRPRRNSLSTPYTCTYAHSMYTRRVIDYINMSYKMNPQKNINENEELEMHEMQRDIKIAEDKRFFTKTFGFTGALKNLGTLSAIHQDREIYRQGNLEY